MVILVSSWIVWYFILKNVDADECASISETIACNVSLSPSSSVLRCYHECLQNKLTIIRKTTDKENIFTSSWKLLRYFFTPQTTSNEFFFFCDDELLLQSDISLHTQYENQCDKTNYSTRQFYQLINKLSITEMEVYDFSDLSMVFNDSYPDLLKLNIHHVFGNKWHTDYRLFPRKEIIFPRSLIHLYITNNHFILLNRDLFWNLPSLKSLDLSENNLTRLRTEQFSFLKNLASLNLSHNSIQDLQESAFYNLTSLKYLDLSFNLLKTLPKKLFAELKKLRELNISRNSLQELENKELFPRDLSLERIDLNINQIKSYHKDLFINQEQLTYIDLSGNQLTRCYQFGHHFNLKILKLCHNKITSLPKYFFNKIFRLKVFKISHNRMKEFNLDNLKYLEDLNIFDASDNNITTIKGSVNIHSNVSKLNFNNNRLAFFPPVWQLLPQLELLDLTFNHIKNVIVPSCFPVMKRSFNINLSFNSIPLYDILPWVNKEKQFQNFKKVNECLENEFPKIFFDLSYNPLHFLNESSLYTFIDPQRMRCTSTKPGPEVSIRELKKEAFSCPFKIECPKICTCGILFKDKSIFVNCTGIGLDMVVQNPPSGTSVLYFNQNYLRNLSSLNIVEWGNLTHLNADYNSLETLEGWIIPPKLQYLSIRGNKLKFLSRDLYDFISSRDSFELLFGGNSRNCNCDSEGMKHFLNRYQEIVPDVKDIICDYENDGFMVSSPLQSISTSVLCGITSNLIQNITIILFLSSITFILGMILLYYKHRYLILSYLYVHCRKAICFNFDEDDDDKIFDAFVAYSSFDRQIVEEILQELEEKEPHFKLCIHERDWLPGKYINENIIKSVQSSKRTILVISENFISSPWFKLELNAAVSKVSKDEMNHIIVVMVDNSATWKGMDKEFRHVVSKRTYLVYGERWFWEKLRYAMPKKTCANTDL